MVNENDGMFVVNSLFTQLIAINPAFKQSWPTEDEFERAKLIWIEAFRLAGINSVNQIRKGLQRVLLDPSPFIPAPGKFISWCQPSPEDIGAPSSIQAFKEASLQCNPATFVKEWSHPCVKEAYRRTGTHQFLNGKEIETRKMFVDFYEQVCKQYSEGTFHPALEYKRSRSDKMREQNLTDEQLEQFARERRAAGFTDEPLPKLPGEEKYEFSSPGILKQYAHLKGRKECMPIIEKLLGKIKEKTKNMYGQSKS